MQISILNFSHATFSGGRAGQREITSSIRQLDNKLTNQMHQV